MSFFPSLQHYRLSWDKKNKLWGEKTNLWCETGLQFSQNWVVFALKMIYLWKNVFFFMYFADKLTWSCNSVAKWTNQNSLCNFGSSSSVMTMSLYEIDFSLQLTNLNQHFSIRPLNRFHHFDYIGLGTVGGFCHCAKYCSHQCCRWTVWLLISSLVVLLYISIKTITPQSRRCLQLTSSRVRSQIAWIIDSIWKKTAKLKKKPEQPRQNRKKVFNGIV